MISTKGAALGRKQINGEAAQLRLPPGTLARIDALLRPGEPRAAFLRAAVECVVERRAIPHQSSDRQTGAADVLPGPADAAMPGQRRAARR